MADPVTKQILDCMERSPAAGAVATALAPYAEHDAKPTLALPQTAPPKHLEVIAAVERRGHV